MREDPELTLDAQAAPRDPAQRRARRLCLRPVSTMHAEVQDVYRAQEALEEMRITTHKIYDRKAKKKKNGIFHVAQKHIKIISKNVY
jgi:hypothetical protein